MFEARTEKTSITNRRYFLKTALPPISCLSDWSQEQFKVHIIYPETNRGAQVNEGSLWKEKNYGSVQPETK
jgi:hypothetical protein